ncbi:hypothetical protein E2C01_039127 [Portunus trituberculatus]|uniref:Uncharacterized protein n=1 Tax=Portunus trituberculatus TaxID=210409 RepID=A0A5B7FJU0_PORTR|nr:hypothetical protein [Portunus trituberculatus]
MCPSTSSFVLMRFVDCHGCFRRLTFCFGNHHNLGSGKHTTSRRRRYATPAYTTYRSLHEHYEPQAHRPRPQQTVESVSAGCMIVGKVFSITSPMVAEERCFLILYGLYH